MLPAPDFIPLTLAARDLACVRGGRVLFEGLSFDLVPGALMAVLGPNGCGKSSLLRLLAGLLRPEAGTLMFSGGGEGEGRAHYLAHADALKPADSLRETLRFWAALTGGGGHPARLEEAAETVGLAHLLDVPVQLLSAGQRRRAGLARLLLAPRALWLLDEPTAALDRAGETLLGALMRGHLAKGGAIAAATHGDLPHKPHATLDLAAAA